MNTKKEDFVDWGSFAEKASEKEWVESIISEEKPMNHHKPDPQAEYKASLQETNVSTFIKAMTEKDEEVGADDTKEWTVSVALEIKVLSQRVAVSATYAPSSKGVKGMKNRKHKLQLCCFICGVLYTHCFNLRVHIVAMQLLRCPKCPRIRFKYRQEHKNHFTRSDNRNNHLYVRSINLSYRCVCGKEFRLNQALLKHIEFSNHPNKVIIRHKPNFCDVGRPEKMNADMLRSLKTKLLEEMIFKLWEDQKM